MLNHDFIDMPSKGEKEMLLRCRWCMKTPMKAREDGCPIHELEEKGSVTLAEFNPEGVVYFSGRACLTCGQFIMSHTLRRQSNVYWCPDGRESEGIEGCVVELNGVKAPRERPSEDKCLPQ